MKKRIFDILFSFTVLLFAFPFFLLLALLIKCTSSGPIFYAHTRVGKDGKPFGCLKFRTMYQDADERLKPLLASDPLLMQEWKTYFKLKFDPRITKIGKFLRKTSMDELPQFLNVLKGEMSIVGPRPLTEYEVKHYLKERASQILSLRPGLTSLWIAHGRNDLSLEKRIELEERYVKEQSFWLDCKLILLTVTHVLFPRGAY